MGTKKSRKQQQAKVAFFSFEGLYFRIGKFRFHIYHLVMIGLVIYGISLASTRTRENYKLAKEGKLTKAMVIDAKKVGGKGTLQLTFKYEVNDKIYKAFWNDEPYVVGDSVYMLYLENDPEITRTYRFIKESYPTDITLPK